MKAMAPQLNDAERERIIELCKQGMSASKIATEVGRSVSTVSNVAASVGHRFGQTNATRAHEARRSYGEEARAELASLAAQRARELLDGFSKTQPVQTKTGGFVDKELDARGQKDRASAAQLLARTVLDIDRHDRKDDGNASAVDTWLRSVVGDAVADAAG